MMSNQQQQHVHTGGTPSLTMNDHICQSLKMGRVFRDNSKEINSMDFSNDGKFLVTSSDDETIHVYDCLNGQMTKEIHSKKYGADHIKFTHDNESVLFASRHEFDDSIRYLSLHDNQFIRYFKGHRGRVVTMSMSPLDDTFISGSLDGSVLFWDLRSANSHGKLDVRGRPVVAYDPNGLCFAVGSSINMIKMYDKRQYDKGPFAQFVLDSTSPLEFLNMKFSPSGKLMSVMTADSLLLIDAFKYNQVAEFTDFENGSSANLEASFTPDEQYIVGGSDNGIVHIWRTHSDFGKVAELPGHAGAVRCVQFNPFYGMLASACTNVAFWIPVSSTSSREPYSQ